VRTAAVVVEYNPMHTGHIYHLEKTREISGADFVVAVMSGDFTQRGEPAIFDKWTRSRIAVCNGADLVLELPFVFACNSAEYFATGALVILKGLGCVDALSFGSESGDIHKLESIAGFLAEETDEYRKALRSHLDGGLSFAAARGKSVVDNLGEEAGEILKSPNNILGVEYIKAARRMGWEAEIMTVGRIGDYHHRGIEGEMASATAIRTQLLDGNKEEILRFLPKQGRAVLEEVPFRVGNPERMYPLIVSSILSGSEDKLKKIFSVNEGMENRMKREVRKHQTFSDFVDALVSKRYTKVGIQRMLIHTLVGFEKQDIYNYPPYVRVLAVNENGRTLLGQIKEKGTLDMVTNINKVPMPHLMKYDILASDLYNLSLGRNLYEYSDYVRAPFVLSQ
jgi:predicted nucleotidyltransferase